MYIEMMMMLYLNINLDIFNPRPNISNKRSVEVASFFRLICLLILRLLGIEKQIILY